MLMIRSWPCPNNTFIILYTTLNLKACKINNASGAPTEFKKVRDVKTRVLVNYRSFQSLQDDLYAEEVRTSRGVQGHILSIHFLVT